MNEPLLTGYIFAIWWYVIVPVSFLVCYAVMAFCLYKIAKRNDIKPEWMAFIPILQYYIIGKAIEEYQVFGIKIPKTQWTIFIVLALIYITTVIPYFGLIIGLIVKAIWVLFLHKFFYLFDSSRAFLYALLCLFGDIPLMILLILLRDKSMVNSPATYEYQF